MTMMMLMGKYDDGCDAEDAYDYGNYNASGSDCEYMMSYVRCTMHCAQCTMYIVRCTMYGVRCAMCEVRCGMYNARCMVYDV